MKFNTEIVFKALALRNGKRGKKMISEYIVFDTKHFIKKTLEREKILPELKRRYAEIDGVSSIDFEKDRVNQSLRSDRMVNIVIDRIRLAEKIKNYEADCLKLKMAIETLTETEKEVFKIYFIEIGNTEILLNSTGLSMQSGYRIRKNILDKIEKVICG